MQKFAAHDDLKILQVEVISECEGLLNLECAHPPYYFLLIIFV